MNTLDTCPPCRVCRRTEWVVVWPVARPDDAICMDCCGTADHPDGEHGHQYYEHSSDVGLACVYCGAPAPSVIGADGFGF